jgi:hypothetical protein
MSDQDLLREYRSGGSERAFQALVERHLNLVYSTALCPPALKSSDGKAALAERFPAELPTRMRFLRN